MTVRLGGIVRVTAQLVDFLGKLNDFSGLRADIAFVVKRPNRHVGKKFRLVSNRLVRDGGKDDERRDFFRMIKGKLPRGARPGGDSDHFDAVGIDRQFFKRGAVDFRRYFERLIPLAVFVAFRFHRPVRLQVRNLERNHIEIKRVLADKGTDRMV